jgi:hypothetical protein
MPINQKAGNMSHPDGGPGPEHSEGQLPDALSQLEALMNDVATDEDKRSMNRLDASEAEEARKFGEELRKELMTLEIVTQDLADRAAPTDPSGQDFPNRRTDYDEFERAEWKMGSDRRGIGQASVAEYGLYGLQDFEALDVSYFGRHDEPETFTITARPQDDGIPWRLKVDNSQTPVAQVADVPYDFDTGQPVVRERALTGKDKAVAKGVIGFFADKAKADLLGGE